MSRLTTSVAMTAWIAAAIAVGCPGCSDRGAGVDEGAAPVTVPPSASDPPLPQCRARPSGELLTQFSAGACGAALVVDDAGVALWAMSPDNPPEPARGRRPEVCAGKAACVFVGYDGALGPLVVVTQPNPRSEMPAGVWLGAPVDGGTRLVFVDLWAGAGVSAVGDGTDLGPPHSLAPFACGDKLALFAVDRLGAADGVEPAHELVARQGVYRWSGDALSVEAATRDGCQRIDVELP